MRSGQRIANLKKTEGMKTNQIGLDAGKSKELVEKLNVLLANYQVFYQNLRGFHWNIRGQQFFELHMKFEELYTDAAMKVDQVAERILTLGGTPLHSFSGYLKHAAIKEAEGLTDGKSTVSTTLSNLKTLLELERELLDLSEEAGDEGTNALISDYITQQEKSVWMLAAYLDGE